MHAVKSFSRNNNFVMQLEECVIRIIHLVFLFLSNFELSDADD